MTTVADADKALSDLLEQVEDYFPGLLGKPLGEQRAHTISTDLREMFDELVERRTPACYAAAIEWCDCQRRRFIKAPLREAREGIDARISTVASTEPAF